MKPLLVGGLGRGLRRAPTLGTLATLLSVRLYRDPTGIGSTCALPWGGAALYRSATPQLSTQRPTSLTPSNARAGSTGSQTGIQKVIEAGWLFAAVLVPAIIAHEDFMVGFIQMPKVFVLRTAALYLLVALALEWALARRPATPDHQSLVSAVWSAALAHPARSIYFGAAAVLLANLASIAFAPVKTISIWGIDPGWDTYGLFNLIAYLVLFGTVATHLRTRDQLRRLLWSLTATSIAISLVSVGQHFGVDPFRSDPDPIQRARSTFGNPIFAGSYLVMTVPLTLALFMSYRDRMSALAHAWIGTGLVALQLTAVLFSLSRGPWVAFIVAAAAWLALIAWVIGRSAIVRPVALVAVAAAIALVISSLPALGAASTPVVARFGTIGTAIGSGLSQRFIIWTTAAEVYVGALWVDTERFPEIPDLPFRQLHRIFGYGPDMFGYAYPLAGEATYTDELASHGHNFIVHTALELGLFGVAAYVGLIGAVGWMLLRMLWIARSGSYPEWLVYVLIGLATALVGRVAEQFSGKAQVSDLALSWMLAGVVVAVSAIRFDRDEAPVAPLRRARRARRVQAAPSSPRRVAVATLGALLILAFWVRGVLVYPVAAWDAARAADAAAAGETQRAIDLYTAARDKAPDLAVTRLQLSQLLVNASQQVAESERPALLQQAYDEMVAILDRNPLDHRARARAAVYLQELALITDDVSPTNAARDSEVLVQLMPGFWQSHAALALAYVRLGRYAEGLEVAATGKALSAQAKVDTHLLSYVEAAALQGLGRLDEALLAAQRSIDEQPNALAQGLIEQLTATAASDGS